MKKSFKEIKEKDFIKAIKKMHDDFKKGISIPMSKQSEIYYKNLVKHSRIPDEVLRKRMTI